MRPWLRENFRDVKTAFASAMALAGAFGVLCCAGVIAIVLLVR